MRLNGELPIQLTPVEHQDFLPASIYLQRDAARRVKTRLTNSVLNGAESRSDVEFTEGILAD
jgi:hypothetical protein